MNETDSPQPSEPNQLVHDALWRGSGGWEIAVAPVVFGLIGWFIDGAVRTRPIFTVIGAIIGLGGAFAGLYFAYTSRMAALAEQRNAAHTEKHGASTGSRFSRNDAIELPDYVLEGDVLEGDVADNQQSGVQA